jgi:preprotein translocase subunit SecF
MISALLREVEVDEKMIVFSVFATATLLVILLFMGSISAGLSMIALLALILALASIAAMAAVAFRIMRKTERRLAERGRQTKGFLCNHPI